MRFNNLGSSSPHPMVRLHVLIVMLTFFGCSPPLAQQKADTFEPWGASRLTPAGEKPGPKPSGGPLSTTARLWFVAYKTTFSSYNGNRCHFVPSCSRFALDATQQMGLYGVLASFGRVNKNHLDHDHYRAAPPFLLDPIANYTFWLRRPQRDDFGAYVDPAHGWFQHVRLTDAD